MSNTKEPTYAGRIENGGAQVVKAPFANDRKPQSKVIRGTDLRTGGNSGKKNK